MIRAGPQPPRHVKRGSSRLGPASAVGVDGSQAKRRKTAPLSRFIPVISVGDRVIRAGPTGIAVMEVRGIEIDQPLLLAFAATLNGLDFAVQFLVRQHPPDLQRFADEMAEQRPRDLAPVVADASGSLGDFLLELESRPGVLDRRFYVACDEAHEDELSGLLSRAGFSVFRITGKALRSLASASLTGRAPGGDEDDQPLKCTVSRAAIELHGQWVRAFHLGRWPRALSPGFVQRLLSLGIPMDLSLQFVPVPTSQAARTLEWQKVKMESASSFSLRHGRSPSPETEIALEDVMRLRDDIHRGRERLFHASLSVAVHAPTRKELNERAQEIRAHFAGMLGSLNGLAFRQREGLLSTLPLALNAVAEWRTVDTTTLAYLIPFSPPDLDTRKGSLFGLDVRSGAPITFDLFDPAFLNANMAVLARSGAGKSFSTKLTVLRAIARGITCYVIDPEGEYVGLAEAASGRVLTPGTPGHGLNPFVIDRGDESEMLERVGGLRRLVEVMVGERFPAERRAILDEALTVYYTNGHQGTGFQDFFRFLGQDAHHGFAEMASLLRPFATGSLRHLLTDEGADLVGHEAPLTVFNLRHLEPELRPAATLVCAEAVWTMATRQPKPRMLVVDEVWSIMQHPEGAAFMVSLAKRARKHRLGLVTITQDVQDFLGVDQSRPIVGHSGRVLLQNSAFKLLLQQDPAAIRAVQEAFDLSPADAQWLTSSPRGEGLLVARGGRFPVRILATAEEHRLIEARSNQP